MTLYLYKTGTGTPEITMEDAVSYTADRVVTADGTVYGPFAEDCELSATADCAGTLRADWRRDNPTAEARLEELEALMAGLLFGGEAE